ncbi:MAG: imidazolonepropionase-like domain-containing protein, partial [Myxococcales bacterium]
MNLLAILVCLLAQAPNSTPPSQPVVLVKAARLIDGRGDTARTGMAVLVQGDRIAQVGPASELSKTSPEVIDLGDATLLPGLIDNHVHLLLQGDVTAADYDEQLLKESIPYRTIRAVSAARVGLFNGFTTMRDLETEGAMYADVDLRNAINRGIVPGPRLFVSTRAMAPTGMYPLTGYAWELKVPEGVLIADGVEGVRKAVRDQVK